MEDININKILSENTNGNREEIMKDKLVKMSFYITYAFLLTTATVTFIESMRTHDIKIRSILSKF